MAWPAARSDAWRDRGAQPAHDPGEADGSAVIRDDQRILVDGDLLFVEQGQPALTQLFVELTAIVAPQSCVS